MDEFLTLLIYIAVLFAVSLAAARLPYFMNSQESRLHLMIAFSAGIMIGVLFVMLLPEALERTEDGGYEYTWAGYMILAGVIVALLFDCLVKHLMPEGDNEERDHDITSMSAFLGLAIHCFFDGLSLAAAFVAGEEIGVLVLIALCLHKVVVVFSLSTTMSMGSKKDEAWKYLVLFCLITPLAAIPSYLVIDGQDIGFAGLALCFSVGIFAFVTLCDMLPESFHENEGSTQRLGLLMLGIAIVIAVALISHELMGGVEI
ncbi:putative divalent heavy-metal cations transporter [Thermoplasmatales archaeon BRNA1]|nr:putative divalent heavy-metal cations transporter [Thermoplasmatales archaeon BRNA1]